MTERRLSPHDLREQLPHRAWRHDERRVVVQGALGMATIALESSILAVGCGILTYFQFRREPIWAPLILLTALAFAAYAVALLVKPVTAVLATLRPIFIADGYLRLRGRDAKNGPNESGYLAVLTESGDVAGEWPMRGEQPQSYDIGPALIEFSEYGGVHTIDGVPTGALPQGFPTLGVGLNPRKRSVG
ncbi:hypothetical protein EPN42_04035 [bacterium]|nr:MAG: hypothetical protein EPN42_04035 [bacterium]